MKSHKFDFVVIGAGIAGLGAARRLAEAGRSVALLEARERVGGRIYTVPAEGGGLPVELGAEFIHGQPPELIELVREAGLTQFEVAGEFRCFSKVNDCLRPQPCDDREAAFAVLEAAGQDPLLQAGSTGHHADFSFCEFLERQSISRKAAAAAINYVEGFNAADAGRISILSLAKQQAAEDAIAGDHAFRIVEGYGRLPEYLLRSFIDRGGEFFPSTQAQRVEWRPGSVEIEASSGCAPTSQRSFRAKAVILTLPLGVLQARELTFVPLPIQIFRAADRLTMGPAARVVYEFEERFWREFPEFGKVRFIFADGAMPPTWWTTSPRRSGLFTGWVGGSKAAGLSVSELVGTGLATLAGILGRSQDEIRSLLLHSSSHDWQKDPLSRGAYSYVPKGAMGASEDLAQPVEKTLFFAGEHTDTTGHWGTVHGALRSGYRAAEQALERNQGYLHRLALTSLLTAILLCAWPLVSAQDEKKDNTASIPPETRSVTQHDLTLDGRTIHYTATAGMLLVRDNDDKPYGSFFSVAYTESGITDPKTRPITFVYNGGPGSASFWLHMGSIGPARVVVEGTQAAGAAPYRVVGNQYSLLDKTDLVFIDAVGTGFSKPVGRSTEKDFAGTDQDVRSFQRFISRYLTVNQRWNSPKYLIGESYGTTRSAALADALEKEGIAVNGVVLISSILNYGIQLPGFDESFIGDLPSYAAIAYYHNKLAEKPANLKSFLNEVRGFARGPYAEALSQGDGLGPEQADAVAREISAYTGLSVQYVKDANLRVSPTRFRKQLLRDQGEILGRYDARFEGTDVDAAGETPGYDPSETAFLGAFVAAFHNYLAHDLEYETSDQYVTAAPSIVRTWDWKHLLPSGGQMGLPYVAGDLADAMRRDPTLKVFSANGLFDLATPFFTTEFDLSHMNLDRKLRDNVQFGYYPAGHMIYLNVDALKQLKDDLESFYSPRLP